MIKINLIRVSFDYFSNNYYCVARDRIVAYGVDVFNLSKINFFY